MIRRQVVVPVSPERLWEALTDPDQVAGWFGGQVAWDLREGGVATFRGDDGSARLGRIETIRPGRHLRFLWWPAPPEDEATAGVGVVTAESEGDAVSEVSYLLEPLEEGTRLTIQERQVPLPAPAAQHGPQACAASEPGVVECPLAWTPWDRRLLGAWAAVVGSPAAVARF